MATRYFVGSNGAWNVTANWSTTSGGAGGASVPASGDTANFDAHSGVCYLTADVSIQYLYLLATYTATVTLNSYRLTVTKNTNVYAGTVDVATGALVLTQNLTTHAAGTITGTTGYVTREGAVDGILDCAGAIECQLRINNTTVGFGNVYTDVAHDLVVDNVFVPATSISRLDLNEYTLTGPITTAGDFEIGFGTVAGALTITGGTVTLIGDLECDSVAGNDGDANLAGHTLTVHGNATFDHSTGFRFWNGTDYSMADALVEMSTGTITLRGASGDLFRIDDLDFDLATGVDSAAILCHVTDSVVSYVDAPMDASALGNFDGGGNVGWRFELAGETTLHWRAMDRRLHWRADDCRVHGRAADRRLHWRAER